MTIAGSIAGREHQEGYGEVGLVVTSSPENWTRESRQAGREKTIPPTPIVE